MWKHYLNLVWIAVFITCLRLVLGQERMQPLFTQQVFCDHLQGWWFRPLRFRVNRTVKVPALTEPAFYRGRWTIKRIISDCYNSVIVKELFRASIFYIQILKKMFHFTYLLAQSCSEYPCTFFLMLIGPVLMSPFLFLIVKHKGNLFSLFHFLCLMNSLPRSLSILLIFL